MFQFVLVLLVLGASDALFLGDGPVPCCVTNIYSAVMMEMAGSLAPNSSRPEIRDVRLLFRLLEQPLNLL